MGLIPESFLPDSYEEVMDDSRWMLGFIAVYLFLAALLEVCISLASALVPALMGLAFLVPVFISTQYLRLAAFAAFVLILWIDFFMRHNPFSIVYSLVGIYHIYILFRFKSHPEPKPQAQSS